MPHPGPADVARSRAAFDALAPTYDALAFLQRAAMRLVERAAPAPGDRVLDVATGTGAVAVAAARAVGPGGRVVGVDLSDGMLARARARVAAEGLDGIVTLATADAARLAVPPGTFDLVLCGSSLFVLPDALAAAREWRRVLVRGGRLAVTSYGPSFLQPDRDRWASRLRQGGVEPAPLPLQRFSMADECLRLFEAAGFEGVEVVEEQLGHDATPAERWRDIEAGMEGQPLRRIDAALRARLREEHLAALEAAAADGRLRIDVPVLFSSGRAP